ncbi:cell division suppressor protein YneA [Tissierellaceae bacterium HCP3S3_D8]
MKRYRIVNKTRFFLFVTFIFIIFTMTITFLTNSIKAHSMILEEEFCEVRISEGDTLWNIALEYMPPRYDVRKMVYRIKKFNDLDTSYIFPGDTIKIPIIER